MDSFRILVSVSLSKCYRKIDFIFIHYELAYELIAITQKKKMNDEKKELSIGCWWHS